MKSILLTALGVVMLSAGSAYAETDCAVSYTRTACPGQEEVSYAKCGGDQSCMKYKEADSLEACQAAANKSCRNRRLNITESKVITATWQGAAIQSKNGNDDFCLDYENREAEFNHCDAQ